jgi:hypothetical protein
LIRYSGLSEIITGYPKVVDNVDELHKVGVEDEDEIPLKHRHIHLVFPACSHVQMISAFKGSVS